MGHIYLSTSTQSQYSSSLTLKQLVFLKPECDINFKVSVFYLSPMILSENSQYFDGDSYLIHQWRDLPNKMT